MAKSHRTTPCAFLEALPTMSSSPGPQMPSVAAALARARAHWRAGQIAQARHCCEGILNVVPDQHDAHHLLGLMAYEAGASATALRHLQQACERADAPAVWISNLSELYRLAGRRADAEAAARRAVAADGSCVEAWNHLGIVLQETGRFEESCACLARVVELAPSRAEAHNNLANTCRYLGRFREAETHYRAALALLPAYAVAYANLAVLLGDLGRFDEAAHAGRQAIELAPRHAHAYLALAGIELRRQGPDAALRVLDALRLFMPGHADELHARVEVLRQAGRIDEARAAVREALASAPEARDNARLRALLDTLAAASHDAQVEPDGATRAAAPAQASLAAEARALLAAGRFEAAEALLRPALASGRGPLALWRLLASAIRPQGRIEETRVIQEMLVAHAPGDLAGRFMLAETLLLLGEFGRGWREYRHRYSLPHTVGLGRKVQRSRWEGQPLPGRTLLIHDEQGYGDTFQFLRMVAWAKARSGARVILEVNAETLPLARRMDGWDCLLQRGSVLPSFDAHCELMSLPMAMGLTLADLPGAVPYLSADPQRLARWRRRLAGLPRPLVALVWAGRPTHPDDANRSMLLERLAPLAVPGVTFVSVQKGEAGLQAERAPARMSLVPLAPEIRDFEDTAAILGSVDLLISVDSSPVHLAGALGRPAWVMLPFVPDWRWLLGRADTPWYPSLRLYRQPARGDWDSVVAALARDLARLVGAQAVREDGVVAP